MASEDKVTLAVGAVIFRGTEVLLIRRGRPPFEGHWSIPGGKVDFGERLADALRREIREETGVEVEILGLIDVFEALPGRDGGARHYCMADYACRYVSGAVVAGDDAREAAFVPYEEAVERLAWDETRLAITRAMPYVKDDLLER